jgi:hypothetical protein
VHSPRALVPLSVLALLALGLACGGRADPAPSAAEARTPDADEVQPTPQDTGRPGARDKAEIQAAVAVAQARIETQEQQQQEAVAAAAADQFCDPLPPGPVSGPACVSGTIGCGDTLRATTGGGTSVFDSERYLDSYCFPTPKGSHTGPERAYALEVPAGSQATVTLVSPCANLDLAVLRWQNTSRCPAAEETISECEGHKGSGSVKMWNNRPARYLVIVDGTAPEGANFELQVSCIVE